MVASKAKGLGRESLQGDYRVSADQQLAHVLDQCDSIEQSSTVISWAAFCFGEGEPDKTNDWLYHIECCKIHLVE